MEKLVTAKNIAERFGVTIDTVYSWTRQGRIPCIKPSPGTVRYDLIEVERALHRPPRPAQKEVVAR